MKTFNKQAAQGELLLTKIDELPDNINLLEVMSKDNKFIIGHSETGHHHVLPNNNVKIMQNAANAMILYAIITKAVELKHERNFDTHESLELKPGIYKINKQQEYSPRGWQKVTD